MQLLRDRRLALLVASDIGLEAPDHQRHDEPPADPEDHVGHDRHDQDREVVPQEHDPEDRHLVIGAEEGPERV